jgi:hypothetical protein
MIRFEEVQAQVQARILDEVQARISAVNKPLALIALPAITSAVNKGEARILARMLAARNPLVWNRRPLMDQGDQARCLSCSAPTSSGACGCAIRCSRPADIAAAEMLVIHEDDLPRA